MCHSHAWEWGVCHADHACGALAGTSVERSSHGPGAVSHVRGAPATGTGAKRLQILTHSEDVTRTWSCVTRTREVCHTDDSPLKTWGRSSLPGSA